MVPTLFGFVYFSRGAFPTKKGERRALLGDLSSEVDLKKPSAGKWLLGFQPLNHNKIKNGKKVVQQQPCVDGCDIQRTELRDQDMDHRFSSIWGFPFLGLRCCGRLRHPENQWFRIPQRKYRFQPRNHSGAKWSSQPQYLNLRSARLNFRTGMAL